MFYNRYFRCYMTLCSSFSNTSGLMSSLAWKRTMNYTCTKEAIYEINNYFFSTSRYTVEPVLKNHPIGHTNVVSQSRWALMRGSVTVKCTIFLPGISWISGLSRQVVSHGSGLSKRVSPCGRIWLKLIYLLNHSMTKKQVAYMSYTGQSFFDV